MILRDRPRFLELFLITRGSVVPRIAPNILATAAWAVVILLADRFLAPMPRLSLTAMGIFGLALSLFLGFRNNAAYDRWWEARRIWGRMVSDLRSFGQELTAFGASDEDRAYILSHIVSFHHLHRAALRGDNVAEDVARWTPDAPADPDAALRHIATRLADMARAGQIDGFGQKALTERLAAFATAQAANERLANTPLPFVYSLLVQRTTWLYCLLIPFGLLDSAGWFEPLVAAIVAYVFFGLSEVTHELEQPFSTQPNAIPLAALCRVMEISASHALGRKAPPPLAPTDHVLS
ncbi:bestrophin family protein [Aliiroseovarius sp.]|uniref:bestrophin family protein n=1 Tax=Aliiroseovarius sp. TaxID=1872442 RepID=UPI003BAAA647